MLGLKGGQPREGKKYVGTLKTPEEVKSLKKSECEHFLSNVNVGNTKNEEKEKMDFLLFFFHSSPVCVCYGLGISIDEMHPYMVSALFLEASFQHSFTRAAENNGNAMKG